MSSPMKCIKLTHVAVTPTACQPWIGTFIKSPSHVDIIDAIRYDHSQLDPDIEHEYDHRDELVLCLQLLDQACINISGEIRIAGTYIGSITTNESEAFERVPSFIDALKAESTEPGDQFFNVLKDTIWDPKV